jgi:histidinol dehydrogenase
MRVIYANQKAEYEFIAQAKERSRENAEVTAAVSKIIADVKSRGDQALLEYTQKFDGANQIKRYGVADFKKAYEAADADFCRALSCAAKNIAEFHQNQLPRGFEIKSGGRTVGQSVRGVWRAGIYVPGGTAAYPSSVLMCAIPAKIAGVKEIVIVSPPNKDGQANADILCAAYIAGADELLLIGGAQAIAALAYGTESIERVDKIVGPGNIYVATAKRLVYGACDIDMVAGPSEILILADEGANPKYVAADLLSQAEHDALACPVLLTDSKAFADRVLQELDAQLKELKRRDIAKKSLENTGAFIICKDIEQMIELANAFAPEHLEIMLDNPERYLEKIQNAGSVFLGEYTPECVGDYYAGANHVLPTGGTARYFSPLSVDDFIKKTQYIKYDKDELNKAAAHVVCIAEKEGLTAHAESIKIRQD